MKKCNYCEPPATAQWQGKERNKTGRGEVKYACTAHKHLINVVAELSPSKTTSRQQAVQEGMF